MKWFIAVILILVAALLLDSGLLAYAMYVLLALLLVSRFLARSWMNGISATRKCDRDTAVVGDKANVTLFIENTGRLFVPWLLLEDLLPRYALDKRFPRLKVKGKRLHITMLKGGGEMVIKYQIECLARGYYQIGPLVLENGDLFGLHRRFRVETAPAFLLVYPRIVTLEGYDLASRRPIGDVRLIHRLYEDPTRIAGVRPYEIGDPLSRIHWRATARTGQLHSKIHEPSTLSGATVLLDFHQSGYHQRGEPFRSELAVVAAVSLANAVYELGQQVGLVTNGRDAADRIRTEGWQHDPRSRHKAREAAMRDDSTRLRPQIVETRRGVEQLQRIRETLARVELTDGLTFADLVAETAPRLPRDATVLAVLPEATLEAAVALGELRRRGFAVTVVLVMLDENQLELAYARLMSEGVRDFRHLSDEAQLAYLCYQQVHRATPYDFAVLGEGS
jgi:uncharacterized protein (DUF58 family)